MDAFSDEFADDFEVLENVEKNWMAEYAGFKGMDGHGTTKNRTIMDRIGLPKRFVLAVDAGRRLALGIAVI